MRCEICGKKILGQPLKTKIESSVMNTCKECSKFGQVQREPSKKQGQFRRTPSALRRQPRPQRPSYEIIEGYEKVVRESREKKGWSREELGEKIYEKVSVINRIESGRMVPDMKLSRKLEKILGIILLEKTDETISEDVSSSNIRGATIGDIARIKRN
ncbi:MAG TPA: multiprotein bridging factor aMBF1 [Methanobacteriaceae archaeon]|nr:multiprotein bridging factor aMBF1 [Methanobacteriaceae archaeon]